MEKTQHIIHEKIGAIQIGLLRCNHKGEKISVPVKIVVGDNNMLNCVAVMDDMPFKKLLHKEVTLIQKDLHNYVYIGGRICQEMVKGKLILSLDVSKATWFERKSKGSVTWLQEKCVYMPEMKMAS